LSKNIIVCCDGTGNEYGKNNTNVVHAYDLANKDDNQIVFYDPGVGTGGWEYNEDTGGLNAKSDSATGYGMQKNVDDAYRFLMKRYEPDDKVYLFGFSRGAFTARSLGGMLYKVGLLGPDDENLVDYAGKIYNTSEKDDKDIGKIAAGFKKTFSQPCPVHFIGVWDTVDSRILNANKKFADGTLNPEISYGYHAISIDERRKDFPVSLWTETPTAGQVIEQVWFAGVHSDVGGWYDERGLSNIALTWILKKARAQGMAFDETKLSTQFRGNPSDKIHESYSGFWKFRRSRRRKIPDGAHIHESVKARIDDPRNNYKPRNLPNNPTYVDGR